MTLQEDVEAVARSIARRFEKLPAEGGERLLIGIAGRPGSGKTSITMLLHRALELQLPGQVATVSMDGFHLTRAQLAVFPDPPGPKVAIARRGAAFTFDAIGWVAFVESLRSSRDGTWAPSFDHAVKDPIAKGVKVECKHRIILLEGLYVMLNVEPWRIASEALDERILVTVPREDARERLARRHLRAGIVDSLEGGYKRADVSDQFNGDWLLKNSMPPTFGIENLQDPSWTDLQAAQAALIEGPKEYGYNA